MVDNTLAAAIHEMIENLEARVRTIVQEELAKKKGRFFTIDEYAKKFYDYPDVGEWERMRLKTMLDERKELGDACGETYHKDLLKRLFKEVFK